MRLLEVDGEARWRSDKSGSLLMSILVDKKDFTAVGYGR